MSLVRFSFLHQLIIFGCSLTVLVLLTLTNSSYYAANRQLVTSAIWGTSATTTSGMTSPTTAGHMTSSRGRGQPIIDEYAFEPRWDQFNETRIIIVLKSGVENLEQRTAVRATWGRRATELNIPVIFAVGLSKLATIQEAIRRENETNGDILQATSYVDDYYNLTLKVYSILRWKAGLNLTDFWFIADDDTLVFAQNLLRLVRELPNDLDSVVGHCWLSGAIVSRGKDRNAVTFDEWPENKWPPYCSGGAGYLLPDRTAEKIEKATRESGLIWRSPRIPEDVAFTGVARQIANVSLQHTSNIHYQRTEQISRCDQSTVSVHRYTPAKDLARMWEKFQKSFANCSAR